MIKISDVFILGNENEDIKIHKIIIKGLRKLGAKEEKKLLELVKKIVEESMILNDNYTNSYNPFDTQLRTVLPESSYEISSALRL